MDAMMNVVGRYKVISAAVLITALALAANLAAMQFTDRVSWSAFDFALISVFLLGFGVAIEFAVSAFRKSTHKLVVGAAVVAVAAVLFVELSVGLVSSPIAGS